MRVRMSNRKDTASSRFLLPRARPARTPKPKELQAIASACGVTASFVDPATLEPVAFEQQEDPCPRYSAPPNVELTGGKVAQLFGVGHAVEAALEAYAALSSGLQESTLRLGSTVVESLEKSNFLIMSIPGLGTKVNK